MRRSHTTNTQGQSMIEVMAPFGLVLARRVRYSSYDWMSAPSKILLIAHFVTVIQSNQNTLFMPTAIVTQESLSRRRAAPSHM